jgi:hypothetical protein
MTTIKELKWVTENPKKIEKFSGKWIAIVDHRILASGKSVNEVVKKSRGKAKKKPLIFKVPRKDEETYIL